MASGNPYFGDFTDAIRMAIPLTINQRNLEAEAKQKDQALQVMRERIAADTLQKALELEKQKQKASTDFLIKQYENAGETGDLQTVQRVAPQLEAALPGIQLGAGDHGRYEYSLPLPKPMKGQGLTDDEREYERAMRDPEFAKYLKDIKAASASKVEVNNIPAGNMPPAKTVVGKLQEDIIDNQVQLQRLRSIKQSYAKEFLQLQGKAKGSIYKMADFLNMPVEKLTFLGFNDKDKQKFLGQRTQFETQTEQLFNLYRKEITGAAAAIQELDRLKKSMLNTDMTPEQFEAAFNAYEKELKRTIRLKNRVLREGLDVRDKDTGGQRLDTRFLAGDDDDVEARGNELKAQLLKQGKYTDEQVRSIVGKQLEAEGYFD